MSQVVILVKVYVMRGWDHIDKIFVDACSENQAVGGLCLVLSMAQEISAMDLELLRSEVHTSFHCV